MCQIRKRNMQLSYFELNFWNCVGFLKKCIQKIASWIALLHENKIFLHVKGLFKKDKFNLGILRHVRFGNKTSQCFTFWIKTLKTSQKMKKKNVCIRKITFWIVLLHANDQPFDIYWVFSKSMFQVRTITMCQILK